MFCTVSDNERDEITAKYSHASAKYKRFVGYNSKTVNLRYLKMLQTCSALLTTAQPNHTKI